MSGARHRGDGLAILGLVLALVLGGCGAPPTPPSTGDDATRRAALRERLRSELGSRYDEPLPAVESAQLRKGEQLYEQLCRACHGAGGKGNGPSSQWLTPKPASLVDPESATFFSDRAQLKIIEQGVSGTAMIGWDDVLDEEDRLNVMAYIRTMRGD